MSETLRRRFIAVAALCVFAVLLVFVLLINGWNLWNVTRDADRTIALITENGGHFPKPHKEKMSGQKPAGTPEQSPEAPFSTRYFTVTLGPSGAELSVNTGSIAAVTTEQAAELATAVAARSKNTGYYGVYRYSLTRRDDATLAIFLDCTRDLHNLRTFALTTVTVAGAGFLAVCALIILFSKAAVRPVVESYEKQKSFITNAGHELKTPLSIIAANAEVIELESGETQWTQSIRNQVERMARLTSQLTALAKMEEDALPAIAAQIPLTELARGVCEEMQTIAEAQGKRIVFRSSGDAVARSGNEEQLRQLLYILLDNAVKHSTAGSPIDVTLSSGTKAAKLVVRNTAVLEKAGDQNILLERFYRTDSSRSRESGGYGLGLSIAKAIVESHKGKITVFAPDTSTLEVTVYI